MQPEGETFERLLPLLGDVPDDHEQQFCDTKADGRILSSGKPGKYAEVLMSATLSWLLAVVLASRQLMSARPTVCQPQLLTCLSEI